jgi:glutamine amidotransferase
VTIALVDACSGNLRSVERALARAGGDVVRTRDPEVIRAADKIVVPGQGAFAMFMRGLVDRDLLDPLREAIASGKPYLGICLGLQVLFDASEEHGEHVGLGILPGRVVKFAAADGLKVPHMGWNQVRGAGDRLMAGLPDAPYVYFVHSYHAVPADPAIVALEADHGGAFCAAVRKDNIFACQFHPEKSQAVGLAILSNFVARA